MRKFQVTNLLWPNDMSFECAYFMFKIYVSIYGKVAVRLKQPIILSMVTLSNKLIKTFSLFLSVCRFFRLSSSLLLSPPPWPSSSSSDTVFQLYMRWIFRCCHSFFYFSTFFFCFFCRLFAFLRFQDLARANLKIVLYLEMCLVKWTRVPFNIIDLR